MVGVARCLPNMKETSHTFETRTGGVVPTGMGALPPIGARWRLLLASYTSIPPLLRWVAGTFGVA